MLDARAKAAYESGPASSLEFFLGAQSLSDLQDRIEIVNAAAASDRSLIDGMTETKNQLHVKETRLDALKAQFLKKEAQLKSQQRQLDEKFAEQKVLLARLATDEASVQALVGQLKVQRQKEIAQALAEAERRRREQQQQHGSNGGGGAAGTGSPASSRSVRSGARTGTRDSFGAPRYGGGYHPHAGNDIMSPLGTPDRGAVRRHGRGRLERPRRADGRRHRQSTGWVYNAHLSAYAATSGSVSGRDRDRLRRQHGRRAGRPHPRPLRVAPERDPARTRGRARTATRVIGTAVDPYPYLNAVC